MNYLDGRKALIVSTVFVIIAIAGWTVYALQSTKNQTPDASDVQTNTAVNKDPADKAAPTPSERVTITFTDQGFEPKELTVERGTIITVNNKSSNSVQFSSDEHPSHRDNAEMNLKTLAPGESTSYTAKTTGEWGFHDHIDDSKTGKITVNE